MGELMGFIINSIYRMHMAGQCEMRIWSIEKNSLDNGKGTLLRGLSSP